MLHSVGIADLSAGLTSKARRQSKKGIVPVGADLFVWRFLKFDCTDDASLRL